MSKIVKTLLLSVAIISTANFVWAATDEVSPELARKAVSGLYEGYSDSGIKISEPKVYFNVDGTLKYYVFYFYGGPDEMPSWNDLERSIDNGIIPKGRWFSVIVNGDRRLPPYFRFDGSPPRVISNKKIARESLESKHAEGDWRYTGACIEGVEVYYIFRSGDQEVLTNMCGEIVNPKEVGLDIDLLGQDSIDRNRKKWEEIETSADDLGSLDDSSERDTGFKDGPEFDDFLPKYWYVDMPEYYQSNYGCASASTADFLGFYSGCCEYEWAGCPYGSGNYKDSSYGFWIMVGQSLDGIYYQYKKYADSGNARDIYPDEMSLGLAAWFKQYGSSYGFARSYGSKGWDPIANWSTLTYCLGDYNGFVLGMWLKGSESPGHCYCLCGYLIYNGDHYVLHQDPNLSPGHQTGWSNLDGLKDVTDFGYLRCTNPKGYGGNRPIVTGLKCEEINNRLRFKWAQENEKLVKRYYIVSAIDGGDSKVFERISEVSPLHGEGQAYSVYLQRIEGKRDYYLDVLLEYGNILRYKFPSPLL